MGRDGGADSKKEPRVRLDVVSPQGFEGSRPVCRFLADRLDEARLAAFVARNPSSSEWSALFAVYVLPESGTLPADQPPLLGRYEVVGNSVSFTPRFSLDPGIALRARLNLRILGGSCEVVSEFQTDAALRKAPGPEPIALSAVRQVSPTGNFLPENLLRFYIQFSQAMSRGEACRHIRLLDALGAPVKDPFLELDEELWSPDGKRFTLLFDPGRIKRGLKPREEIGPVLQEGRSYTLVIDRRWPDAAGHLLAREYRKSFRVGPPDMTPPDPGTWRLSRPRGACLDPLEVRFPEPLDHALVMRLISVVEPSGEHVEGAAELTEDQTLWRFVPASFWKTGATYRLVVGTELEDLAGNAIGRPFEVDLAGPITSRVEAATFSLPFRIGPGTR
jgi:hypothetical protein